MRARPSRLGSWAGLVQEAGLEADPGSFTS